MAKHKVLVVEDSPTMRKIIVTQLKQLGYTEVKEAENGKNALSLLSSTQIDLILTDWNMPVMDGQQMVQAIRQTEGLKDVPILMVTTRNTKADVVQALKGGVNNYVTKPFKPSDLRKKIDGVMAAKVA